MTSKEIREKFFKYWTAKERNFKAIPNVSLVPNTDSSLLFVNAGMFPLVPYLSGEKHPLGPRLCSIQRCLRPMYEEVLEVGDNRHVILFEMIGNWSLGDFTKVEQIPWILDFYVEEIGLDPKRIYISIFKGDKDVEKDTLAIQTWQKAFKKYGIEAKFSDDITQLPNENDDLTTCYRIFPYGKDKNWWQRGNVQGELGGPSSEMFYDTGVIEKELDEYHINDESGRFVEIGNNVFMEYYLDKDLEWQPLKQKNIDFGGGFERLVMCSQNKSDVFETDLFQTILQKIENMSGKKYKTNGVTNEYTHVFRIIADHARAAAFIIADGVVPSNKDQGYILRRFIRRMCRFGKMINLQTPFCAEIALEAINVMSDAYPYLKEQQEYILEIINKEEKTFSHTLENGLKEVHKLKDKGIALDGKTAFFLYETYGFPLELSLEEFNIENDDIQKITEEFKTIEDEHKKASRAGAYKKFTSGLADRSDEVIKLHTIHHLLLHALQKFISKDIKQKGSNINADRLRLDFNFQRKLDDVEKTKIEEYINEIISSGFSVERIDLPFKEAEKMGAEMEFGQKYPDIVSVYIIKNKNGEIISKEFCSGPHIKDSTVLNGLQFKIIGQENIGSGLKRIKAKLI